MDFKTSSLLRYLLGPIRDLELCQPSPLLEVNHLKTLRYARTSIKSKHSAFRRGRTEQAVSNGLKLPCQTAVSLSQFNQHIHQTGAGVYGSLMDVQEQQANNDESQNSLQDYYCLAEDFHLTRMQMIRPCVFQGVYNISM